MRVDQNIAQSKVTVSTGQLIVSLSLSKTRACFRGQGPELLWLMYGFKMYVLISSVLSPTILILRLLLTWTRSDQGPQCH